MSLYINGEWVRGQGNTLEVVNPATEELMARVDCPNAQQVDQCVAAARHAFETSSWAHSTGKERAAVLRAIAAKLQEYKGDISVTECKNVGKPLKECEMDVDDSSACFEYYATLAEKLDDKQGHAIELPEAVNGQFETVMYYEPVGVAALIVPWNYPLLMATWKVAPALAAGCSVILKPSEITPLTAITLAKAIHECNVPKGVFNLLPGAGDVGALLTAHHGIDKVGFTGSLATGAKIGGNTSQSIKNLTLELGGKSPIIVFEDANIDEAVEWLMFGILFTNGQICSATSRALIHESIYDRVAARLVEEMRKVHVEDPFSKNEPLLGAIVNKTQYEKVLGYIKTGIEQGATLLTGGKRPANQAKGFFIEPTVFGDCTSEMTVWKEEIFGPVLCIRKFKTEQEAIHLANDSEYGLAAAVLTYDNARAQRVVRAFRAGIVWVNCAQPTFCQAPWGGMKKSGIGRDLGEWGLNAYLEPKQVTRYLADPGKWAYYVKSQL